MRLKIVSPSQASILACATILSVSVLAPVVVSGYSVGFVYNDLLAHPQYHVQYLDELVPMSAIGTEKLHRGNMHRQPQTKATPQIETSKEETQNRDQGRGQDQDQGQSQNQDPLSRDSNTQDHEQQQSASPARSTVDLSSSMLMTDADGQRWACTIPSAQMHEVEPEPEKTTQEIEEEERRSVKRGLDLLEHLSKRCLRTNYGYWTYEYCHKKRIRQYHAADNIKWEPVSEELTNILAVYQPPPAEIQSQPNIDGSVQQQSPVLSQEKIPTSTELGVSNERKYLVQHWDYGQVCDVTGAYRKVEVQFQCANVDDRIQLVNEPSICNYIMVIYSSSLCKDVAFELIPAPEANKIDCRRIVTDEQYQHRKIAGPEAIEGGIGSSVFQESTGQIKFGQQPEKEFVANLKLVSGYKGMAALIEQVEKAATKHKHLDEILSEFDAYFELLNPLLTKEQRDALQKVEDFVDSKASQLEPLGFDENGQPSEMDSLLETLFGAASSSNGVKDQGDKVESKGEVQQDRITAHEKKDRQEVFQMILDALAENDNSKATQDTVNKNSRDKTVHPKTEKDDAVSSIDLASLLEILDATRRTSTTSGSADGDDKDEIKEKDGDAE